MDDRKSLVPVNFKEFDFVIAIHLTVSFYGEVLHKFPPEVGRFTAKKTSNGEKENLDLVDCDKVLSKSVMETSTSDSNE